ncbi:MAG TPA: hypothetical protein VFA53_03560 [Xanthobacteraceae bacterium]|nr:hypothetical protein [Xanthobacteraceae bacterium]
MQLKAGRVDQYARGEEMTMVAAHVRVLNSLLFIRDAYIKTLPLVDGNGAVWSTPSCVAVSCMPDSDGPTEIKIGASSELPGNRGKLLFDAQLETPSRRIIVETVLAKNVLERDVSNTVTRVRIWTNGLRDTNKVIIVIG